MGRGRRLFDYILVFENYPVDEGLLKRMGMTINLDEVQNLLIHNTYPLTLRASLGKEVVLEVIYDRERFVAADVGSCVGGGVLRWPVAGST